MNFSAPAAPGQHNLSALKRVAALFAACAVFALAFCMPGAAHAVKTYTQKSDALAPYDVGSYKVVNNKKLTSTYTSYTYDYSGVLKSKKGVKAAFKTYLGLTAGENLQSFVVTPDGKRAYGLITKTHENNNSQKGWVREWNLAKIRANHAAEVKAGEAIYLDDGDTGCIRNGKVFTTGHGQALAYNAKAKQLVNWQANKCVDTNVQLISTKTLTPKAQIKFKLRAGFKCGNNLTFDAKGRAYFYTRHQNGSWAPKNAIKLYQGTIDFSKHKVRFRLVMQCLRYPMGQIGQSLGFNPKNNRLYFVDNGSITSVPVGKLGELKPSDVRQTLFKGKREFESIAFDKAGRAYLSVCNPREIMSTTGF